jgi:hypothetical protein
MNISLFGPATAVIARTEWMRNMPIEAWKARHTYSLWAFPQADYPKLLTEYFAFCKNYYKEHRYRANLVTGANRVRGTTRAPESSKHWIAAPIAVSS